MIISQIREYVKYKGMTQRQFAAKIGISLYSLSAILNHRKRINSAFVKSLEVIGDLYDIIKDVPVPERKTTHYKKNRDVTERECNKCDRTFISVSIFNKQCEICKKESSEASWLNF